MLRHVKVCAHLKQDDVHTFLDRNYIKPSCAAAEYSCLSQITVQSTQKEGDKYIV